MGRRLYSGKLIRQRKKLIETWRENPTEKDSAEIVPESDWKDGLSNQMRDSMTPSECKIWKMVRGMGFKAQVRIGPYIADFAHSHYRIVIEADGNIHSERSEYDRQRDASLTRAGWSVLRFSNDLIATDGAFILKEIQKAMSRPRLIKRS